MSKNQEDKPESMPLLVSARGHADAALILACAGLGWLLFGLSAVGSITLTTFLAILTMFAGLLVGLLVLKRSLRAFPPTSASPQAEKVLLGATIFEVIAILLSFLIAGLLHRPDITMPLVALAVGLHFFPIARVLRRPLYLATGAALCAVAVGVPLFVPQHWGVRHFSGWQLAGGLGGGLVIWLTTLALLGNGWKLRRELVASGNAR